MSERTCQNDGRGRNLTNESLMDLLLEAEKRADAAEAAVERVREALHAAGSPPIDNPRLNAWSQGWNACRAKALRALDGGA